MAGRSRGRGASGGRGRGILAFVVILAVGVLVGSALSQWGGPAIVPLPEGVRPRVTERVRVEVLNGGAFAGAARQATDTLRELGFDVVFFGNAGPPERDTSVVIDRSGAVQRARGVADALSIRNVRTEPDSNLYLDVSVVLGKDWAPVALPEPEDQAVPARPWWDPRGWIGR